MNNHEFHPIFPSDRQIAFEQNWSERHDVPAESLAQYRHATAEGYRLPDLATNFRTFCAALEWSAKIDEANPVVVYLPPMNPQAGRLVTTLAKSMHNAYVTAIEAAGAKVVIQ
ncbi:MAG: hypothetical protein RR740_08990 [Pseudomonas sp.]